MVYVASPYGHPDQMVVESRFIRAVDYCNMLLSIKTPCISPVVYGHPIYKYNTDLKVDWDSWKDLCTTLMASCTELHILMLNGWEDSVGVGAEIAWAKELGIKIVYVSL